MQSAFLDNLDVCEQNDLIDSLRAKRDFANFTISEQRALENRRTFSRLFFMLLVFLLSSQGQTGPTQKYLYFRNNVIPNKNSLNPTSNQNTPIQKGIIMSENCIGKNENFANFERFWFASKMRVAATKSAIKKQSTISLGGHALNKMSFCLDDDDMGSFSKMSLEEKIAFGRLSNPVDFSSYFRSRYGPRFMFIIFVLLLFV